MRKTLSISIFTLCVLFSSAEAATITVGLGEGPLGYGGGEVTLTDQGEGNLLVDIWVESGEIRGFFFDLDGVVTGLTASSPTPATTIEICAGPVDSCPANPGGNLMNPYGPFDWGLSIGGPGNDAGLENEISFVLSATDLSLSLFEGQQVGVRVQQIPIPGSDEEGSAKLIGVGEGLVPPEEIPEPTSMMMLAGGIGLLALSRLRR